MSKLIYLMPVWAGCDDYLVSALQVSLKKVARLVTKLAIFTPTMVLMQQCVWMSVRELMIYQSILLLHKTLKQKSPVYLYRKVTSGSVQHNTRQAASSKVALEAAGVTWRASVADCELELTRNSWCWTSVNWYSQLPPDLLAEPKLKIFKTRLKG